MTSYPVDTVSPAVTMLLPMPPIRPLPIPDVSPADRLAVNCPLCGSDRALPRHRVAGYDYLTCDGCGLVYLSPRPTESSLRALYQGYLPSSEDDLRRWARMMAPVHDDLVHRATAANGGPGRVCDIGCGHGFLLETFHRTGWSVTGVEIAEDAARAASERAGVRVHVGSIDDVPLEPGSFDAVTACYVIEHLPDPPAFLRRVRDLVRPGGHILLRWPHTTPLLDVLARFGPPPNLYDAPWHLVDFSPETIARALREAGWEEIRSSTGGWTRPPEITGRLAAILGGGISTLLEGVSGGRWLLPGVSKTTVARRP